MSGISHLSESSCALVCQPSSRPVKVWTMVLLLSDGDYMHSTCLRWALYHQLASRWVSIIIPFVSPLPWTTPDSNCCGSCSQGNRLKNSVISMLEIYRVVLLRTPVRDQRRVDWVGRKIWTATQVQKWTLPITRGSLKMPPFLHKVNRLDLCTLQPWPVIEWRLPLGREDKVRQLS